MANIGGSLRSVRINGRNYSPTSDGRAEIEMAEVETEVEITGDRNLHVTETPKLGTISDVELSLNDDDYGALVALQNARIEFEVSIQFASGAWYGGVCRFNEFPSFSADSKATFSFVSANIVRIA